MPVTATKTPLKTITKKQCTEFGQIAILVTLYFAIHNNSDQLVIAALVFTLVTIVLPYMFYPFAFLWFGLSALMSRVGPVIILTIVFFLVLTPVGLTRKLLGKDSLQLKQFKKDKRSAMINREHLHTAADLLHTF